jgi:hypothetical protein
MTTVVTWQACEGLSTLISDSVQFSSVDRSFGVTATDVLLLVANRYYQFTAAHHQWIIEMVWLFTPQLGTATMPMQIPRIGHSYKPQVTKSPLTDIFVAGPCS